MKTIETARQAAIRDMAASGINTVFFVYEADICKSLGLEKPNFRRMKNYEPKCKKSRF